MFVSLSLVIFVPYTSRFLFLCLSCFYPSYQGVFYLSTIFSFFLFFFLLLFSIPFFAASSYDEVANPSLSLSHTHTHKHTQTHTHAHTHTHTHTDPHFHFLLEINFLIKNVKHILGHTTLLLSFCFGNKQHIVYFE